VDTSHGEQRNVRIDHLSCRHKLCVLDVVGFIIFCQVEEEDALADVVVAPAKLFTAVEA